jgi:hypothetical protein
VVCDKRISDVSDIRHSDNTNRSCALKSSNIGERVNGRPTTTMTITTNL